MDARIQRLAHTKQGTIEGKPGREPRITVYRGVPYASPPVAALRWRPPQPPTPWQGTRPYIGAAILPVQRRGMFTDGGRFDSMYRTEDCLYLNIWTSAQSPGARQPVMVWFYGGGFTGGHASDPMYDSEAYAAQGIVCVTVNFRVGVMGFLCHPGLLQEGGTCGNYGLLDQLEALRWVRENIAAFGGDPDRVTLMGQSTGALGLCHLVGSPKAKGLYRGMILQSGDPLSTACPSNMDEALRDGAAFAAHVGAGTIDDLRRMPAADLVPGDVCRYEAFIGHPPFPVADSVNFPMPRPRALLSRQTAGIDLLVGSNADDCLITHLRSETDLMRHLRQTYGEHARTILRLYPFQGGGTRLYQARTKIERDSWFVRLRALGDARAAMNLGRTWQYFFSKPVIWQSMGSIGAVHVAELPHVFGTLPLLTGFRCQWNEENDALHARMARAWGNFIRFGDPNGEKGRAEGLPAWAPNARTGAFMEFGSRVAARRSHRGLMTDEQYGFWMAYYARMCGAEGVTAV